MDELSPRISAQTFHENEDSQSSNRPKWKDNEDSGEAEPTVEQESLPKDHVPQDFGQLLKNNQSFGKTFEETLDNDSRECARDNAHKRR